MLPAIDRLLNSVAVDASGCWIPSLKPTGTGYSQVSSKGTMLRGHRLVYEAKVGPIPDGLDLDHLCRNRRCVNPDHLEPVTRGENLRRSPLVKPPERLVTPIVCPAGHYKLGSNKRLAYDAKGEKTRLRCRECDNVKERERKHVARTFNFGPRTSKGDVLLQIKRP